MGGGDSGASGQSGNASGQYAFASPDAAQAFGAGVAQDVATARQQYEQTQSAFNENRAFRNYIKQISEGASTKRGAVRYGINSIT
jgi:hypothetical protein